MSSTPVFPPRRPAPARRPLVLGLAAALLAPALALIPAAALAGAPVVSNCNDSGTGSLRAAVAAAGSGEVIDLGGLACNSITLSGVIQVNGIADLSIRANAAQNFSIVAGGQDRAFAHAGAGQLSLANLAIRDGRSGDAGGCVYSQADLRLDNVSLSNCAAGSDSAQGAHGGAAAAGSNLVINASRISDNQVDGTGRVSGGGVWAGGTVTASDSEFRNNHAHSHAGSGSPFDNIVQGGAIQADLGLVMSGSQVIGNTVLSDSYEVYGGGVSAGIQENNAQSVSLVLIGSTISGNTAQTLCDVCAPQGGGGMTIGDAELREVTISDNVVTSTNHYGGGGGFRFFGDSASASIFDSVISGNEADSAGGGLIGPGRGVLHIERSRIENNEAGNQAGLGEAGGGILTFGGAVELISSSVTGNISGADGGGINVLFGEYAPVPNKIINSTISGNSAREGGGINLSGGNLQMRNSTITLNTATNRGAGISADQYSYDLNLASSIVAGNTTAGASNNVWAFPETVNGANNIIPNAGSPAQMPADTLTTDPQLLPLASNGGPTLTHALAATSPAIDAGGNPLGLATDQRGGNWLRSSGAGVDIGAFELQPLPDTLFADSFDSQ
jgi:hypothetical protein